MIQVRSLVVDHALTREGWQTPAALEIDESGIITSIGALPRPGALSLRLRGYAIPGMPNLHSHAFQRVLSGRTERAGPAGDSFWTWRELMYGLAAKITPEDLETIAHALYVEMLEAGMTSVAEFHYLHHDRDGTPYADRAELSRRIAAGAQQAGIDLLLLPVLYQRGGFGQAPKPSQRRFIHDKLDDFLALLAAIERIPGLRLGVAPHSLRAVEGDALIALVRSISAAMPIHIHVAEQLAEVEQCLSTLGKRPIQHLLDDIGLDPRWCLIHATHADPAEIAGIAGRRAIVGLCPSTEANLGDGLFDARRFWASGGRFGIGSDSHATVSSGEELRLLEYGQRLLHRERNVLAHSGGLGQSLWLSAVEGGAAAVGRAQAGIAVGAPADLVVLEPDHPRLLDHGEDTLLDAFVFGSADRGIAQVIAGGKHVVKDGRHVHRDRAFSAYRRTVKRLLSAE